MTPPSPPILSRSTTAPRASLRALARAVAAALLIAGGTLTIGALWLPWRHSVPPESTTPYIPIAARWAHSFLVFTAGAFATGVLAWLTAVQQPGQAARVLALGCILCACAGVVFASLGVDGAQVWRSSEATDAGFYVCLLGYAALIAAGGLILATRGTAQRQ
jgi:hypothetical protein